MAKKKENKINTNIIFRMRLSTFKGELKKIFSTGVELLGIFANTDQLILGGDIAKNLAIKTVFKPMDGYEYNNVGKYLLIEKKYLDTIDIMDGEYLTLIYEDKKFIFSDDEVRHKVDSTDDEILANELLNGITNVMQKISEDTEDYYICDIPKFAKVLALANKLTYTDAVYFEPDKEHIKVFIKQLKGGITESDIKIPVTNVTYNNTSCLIHKSYIKGFKLMDKFTIHIHESKPIYAFEENDITIKEILIASRNSKSEEDYDEDESETEVDFESELEENEDFDLD